MRGHILCMARTPGQMSLQHTISFVCLPHTLSKFRFHLGCLHMFYSLSRPYCPGRCALDISLVYPQDKNGQLNILCIVQVQIHPRQSIRPCKCIQCMLVLALVCYSTQDRLNRLHCGHSSDWGSFLEGQPHQGKKHPETDQSKGKNQTLSIVCSICVQPIPNIVLSLWALTFTLLSLDDFQ